MSPSTWSKSNLACTELDDKLLHLHALLQHDSFQAVLRAVLTRLLALTCALCVSVAAPGACSALDARHPSLPKASSEKSVDTSASSRRAV